MLAEIYANNYALIAIMALLAIVTAVGILVATHIVGPKRVGDEKHATYESGVAPIGDARRRFNVRFYLVAVLFLVLDVEIAFLIPWAVTHKRFVEQAADLKSADALTHTMLEQGFTPGFWLAGIGVFFLLLLVGFAYEWRKGIFRWD